MRVADPSLPSLDNSFARELPELCLEWTAAPVPDPELLVLNDELAAELGLEPDVLTSPDGVALLCGNAVPPGATPVAQVYAGHQFGAYSPRLGDGRALLLGELRGGDVQVDLHLKGSGRTPFARGGDGKAAVGPMLREWVVGEAMHAFGIPTTRALAVVATNEQIRRDRLLPGAVLARIAASHVRVGTFQYAASTGGPELVARLVDHAIARLHPARAGEPNPPLALFDAVIEAQASLVASWMGVGFVHGVMNTDNTTISGETIDYGPCAFVEAFDPATVFSSIDHGGRYAYGQQPAIVQWNLARLAETLLALIDDDAETAVSLAAARLDTFPDRYNLHLGRVMRAKLGLTAAHDGDDELLDGLLGLLHHQRVDMTEAFRSLAAVLRGEPDRARSLFGDPSGFDEWSARWCERIDSQGRDRLDSAAAMDAVNPRYIPRNQALEAALDAATAGDLAPVRRLVDAVRRPFVERPGFEDLEGPAPEGSAPYRTFCGT